MIFVVFLNLFLSKGIQAQVQNNVQKQMISVAFRTRFSAKLYKHRFKTDLRNRPRFLLPDRRTEVSLQYSEHGFSRYTVEQWFICGRFLVPLTRLACLLACCCQTMITESAAPPSYSPSAGARRSQLSKINSREKRRSISAFF